MMTLHELAALPVKNKEFGEMDHMQVVRFLNQYTCEVNMNRTLPFLLYHVMHIKFCGKGKHNSVSSQ